MRNLARFILPLMAIMLLGFSGISQAGSISGTVTNNTGKTGRIYIKATTTDWGGDWSYGISIPAGQTSYTISSLPDSFDGHTTATYTLSAFADLQGVGEQHANDPTVTLGSPVTIGSTSANLTLALPSYSPPQANEIIAYQGNGGNTLIWKPYEADNGLPIADKYVVSWSTNADGSGASSQEVYSGVNSYMFFHNNGGTNLYYRVTAYVGSATASTQWVPVTTRTGGVTVSGSVTLSGVTTTKPLIVLLKQEIPGQYPLFYSTIIPAPSTSGATSYSISNVPAGTYTFHAFLDVNQDGVYGPGDLDYQPSIYASEEIVVGASPTAGISPTITQRNAYATIRTNNWIFNGSPSSKNLGFTVEAQAKQPVNVTVSGAGLLDNTPIGFDNDEGTFRIWPGLSTTPVEGGSYTYKVYYSDNPEDKDEFTVTVPAFLTSFATPTSPIGTVTYTDGIPTFSWSAPSSPPSPYYYHLWLSGADASWHPDDLPPTQTSILYNADEGASKTALTAGVPYYWAIFVLDRFGNQAAYQTSFTMSNGISFTGKTISPISGNLSGVKIEQDGNPSNYTTSGNDGSFTLSNLPINTSFRLKITLSGYLPVYTQYFTTSSNLDLTSSPYNLLTQTQLYYGYGQTSGKGVIIAGFADSNGTPLSDVTVSVPGYIPQYMNGLAMLFNVAPDTPVTITPTKSGYTFSPQTFSVPANSILEVGISASPSAYTLGLQRNGSGSGLIQIQINGISTQPCTDNSCSYSGIPAGVSIQLTAVPDTGSSFGGWYNCGSSTSVCNFTLTGNTFEVTATFSLQPFKLEDSATYYNTLLSAFDNAPSGKKILGQKNFAELQTTPTYFNRSTSTDQITFKGGYNDSFSSRATTDFSTITPLIIQSGTLILDQVIVK